MGAPSGWVEVTALPPITTLTWVIVFGMEGGEINELISETQRGEDAGFTGGNTLVSDWDQ